MVHILSPKSNYLIVAVAFIHQNIEETDVLDPERIDRLVPYFKALATIIQTYKLTDFAVTTTHPIPKTKNKQPLIAKEATFTGNVRIIDKNGETLWFRGEGIANELHRGIEGYEPIEITNERAGAKLNSIYLHIQTATTPDIRSSSTIRMREDILRSKVFPLAHTTFYIFMNKVRRITRLLKSGSLLSDDVRGYFWRVYRG